ncbi:hypothetical protein ACQKMI_15215 [Lysinibacillus sp. NPDC097214]|uniref:hypothetical protein n=1 Tax=Lysinibacillus sp. NPDC097214 TaxID=3390584 RepID=UPI003D0253DA
MKNQFRLGLIEALAVAQKTFVAVAVAVAVASLSHRKHLLQKLKTPSLILHDKRGKLCIFNFQR